MRFSPQMLYVSAGIFLSALSLFLRRLYPHVPACRGAYSLLAAPHFRSHLRPRQPRAVKLYGTFKLGSGIGHVALTAFFGYLRYLHTLTAVHAEF